MARTRQRKRSFGARLGRLVGRLAAVLVIVLSVYYGACALLLLSYNVVSPPTTGVQIQRRVESFFDDESYEKRYEPVARAQMSPHLPHAVVAAEDSRFYQHTGIDWEAVQEAIEDNRERGRTYRGGSTITQQLVKNLFQTTHSSYVRKALEVPLTYLAELLLSKERLLTLYLNVIEWGRGVYGAEAAAQHYYGTSARGLSRYQAAALAACIPDPRGRSPQRMGWYTNIILRRMQQMGHAPAPPSAAPQTAQERASDAASDVRPARDSAAQATPAVKPMQTAPPSTPPPSDASGAPSSF